MIRALLLYTSAGGGHRSAAHAIAAELRTLPGAQVEVRDVLDFTPRWFAYSKAWSLVQRRGPHAWDWLFDITERGTLDLDPVRLPLNAVVLRDLDRYLLATRPTHVVCTHYLPALAVARVASAIQARTIVAVTDHLAHRAWLVPGVDAYCVANASVARYMRARTRAEVIVTGIPIAAEFDASSVRAVAPEFRITPPGLPSPLRRARILALLGGVPRGDARAVIDELAALEGTHELVVLTGSDQDVRAHAHEHLPRARIADRTESMPAELDAADVVVTKAGGLIVSECLARGRALVLPFHAPGQERGNARYAVTAGAAVRPELAELAATLDDLVATRGALRRMAAHARRAASPDSAALAAQVLVGRMVATTLPVEDARVA